MSELFIPDEPVEGSSGLLICTGTDIDFETSDADAIIEITAADDEGFIAMGQYGYTLNLEQAVAVVDVLLEAIRNAEQK